MEADLSAKIARKGQIDVKSYVFGDEFPPEGNGTAFRAITCLRAWLGTAPYD